MTLRLLLASALLALAACTPHERERANLALACQIKACVCKPARRPLFTKRETTPVLWRQNGEAYCPDDYVLRYEGERSNFQIRHGGSY